MTPSKLKSTAHTPYAPPTVATTDRVFEATASQEQALAEHRPQQADACLGACVSLVIVDEDAPDPLKAPVDGTKGAGDGRSRNDRNDLGVLDPPVDEPKGAGRADATDDAGSAPALDPTVEPV